PTAAGWWSSRRSSPSSRSRAWPCADSSWRRNLRSRLFHGALRPSRMAGRDGARAARVGNAATGLPPPGPSPASGEGSTAGGSSLGGHGTPGGGRAERGARQSCVSTARDSARVECPAASPSPAMHGLNPQQSAAVAHVEGPLLVLAGAGSGKTRVIVEKIAHLIASRRYPARRIAAITFTNKSAREMRERVARRIKGDAADGLTVCTFHALGLKILQIEHARAGLRRGFSIFDADDTASQLK